jgi:hypothetical protein
MERCEQEGEARIRRTLAAYHGKQMGNDQATGPSGQLKHYCRGCGGQLPPSVRAHFHKECLQADKRNRTLNRRAQEKEKFVLWLKKQRCPSCGAGYGSQRSGEPLEASCEASQTA